MGQLATGPELIDFTSGIRVLARLARVAELALNKAGISMAKYRLLISILDRPQRAGELAISVGVSRPTLTALMDGLEREGLVVREPVHDDRRGTRLSVTDAGRVAIVRAEAALSERLNELSEPEFGPTIQQVVRQFEDALEFEDAPCAAS